jgi:hypothetical protein
VTTDAEVAAGHAALALIRAITDGDDQAAAAALGQANLRDLCSLLGGITAGVMTARAHSAGVPEAEVAAWVDAHLIEALQAADSETPRQP